MHPHTLLVIGYGNTLRRDDGVGVKVAEAVAALDLPRVNAVVLHQLVPELAELISQSETVVFVDADMTATGETQMKTVEAADTAQILAHAADPRSLLALSKQIYGHLPEAWTLSIPVEDLGFGEKLSLRAKAGLRAAVLQIKHFAQQEELAEQKV